MLKKTRHDQTPSLTPITPWWRTPEALIAAFSLVVSVASFIIAFRSCGIAERGLQLSSQDFFSQRTVVYRGKLNDKKDEIFLTPIDPAIQLQRASVYFPPQLSNHRWDVLPPDFGLPLVVLENELANTIDKVVPKETGFVKVLTESSVPCVIESSYVAKGQSYEERSLYEVVYLAVVSDEPYKRPSIEFKGISFLQRLPTNTRSQKYVEKLWNEAPPPTEEPTPKK